MLKQARNGGSITPKYDRILQQHILRNRLEILPYTQIESGDWDPLSQTWRMRLSKDVPGFPEQIDHVNYATGNPPRIDNITWLKRFVSGHPVEAIDGLTRITNDLMWNDEIPLFLTGGLAGLRLGPGAANLVGARQGAERIAWKIDELLGSGMPNEEMRPNPDCKDNSQHSSLTKPEQVQARPEKLNLLEKRSEFTGGFANQFEALALHLEAELSV